MNRIFFIGLFLILTKQGFCLCLYDNRNLTERLVGYKPGTIFTGKILSTEQGEDGNFYSYIEISELFFGDVDSNIVKLNTGDPTSSEPGGPFPVGAIYLIYGKGSGSLFYCGGSCDRWTKQIKQDTTTTNELENLRLFSNIIKQQKSGLFTFYFAEGKVAAKGSFFKGKPSGVWRHYYTNGNLKSLFNRRTKWIADYSEDGILSSKQQLKHNTLTYCKYSKSVPNLLTQKYIEEYNDSLTTMTTFEYYEAGKLKRRSSSIHVKIKKASKSLGMTGIYEEYYPNGKLSIKGKYFENKEIGIWTYYKENGEIEKQIDHDK